MRQKPDRTAYASPPMRTHCALRTSIMLVRRRTISVTAIYDQIDRWSEASRIRRRFGDAAALDFGLRLVVVDGIQMRMANHGAPSNFLADVMHVRVVRNLDLVGGFGLDTAHHLALRRHEGMVAARGNSRGLVAAGDRRLHQRAEIAIGAIDVDHLLIRLQRRLLE